MFPVTYKEKEWKYFPVQIVTRGECADTNIACSSGEDNNLDSIFNEMFGRGHEYIVVFVQSGNATCQPRDYGQGLKELYLRLLTLYRINSHPSQQTIHAQGPACPEAFSYLSHMVTFGHRLNCIHPVWTEQTYINTMVALRRFTQLSHPDIKSLNVILTDSTRSPTSKFTKAIYNLLKPVATNIILRLMHVKRRLLSILYVRFDILITNVWVYFSANDNKSQVCKKVTNASQQRSIDI
ncbi:unnamed protein product [Didymodactylos carnosus]|uniref:Uncharacterized protein n=1 Tax=Didymodactylos carnosus TaxID=1234261 RepID=A0A8S2GEN6_9BILA|nr:unnamed protein product [Didymodactylos carnosus]CAF3504469.1 unnamed protein product [Didymodactylos carnosus]